MPIMGNVPSKYSPVKFSDWWVIVLAPMAPMMS